jgi:hypothetical protein
MRTKTTLLCAAALAAGVVGSMAQSNVYSLNIVGYVNVEIKPGNYIYANPLNLDGTNNAANIFTLAPLNDSGGQPAGTMNAFGVLTWGGASFSQVWYESDWTLNNGYTTTNGWAIDQGGDGQGSPPNLNPGTGFFIHSVGNDTTNTFVGSVVPLVGATNANPVAAGNFIYGSALPVSGSLASVPFQFPLAPLNDSGAQPAGTLSGIGVLTWTGSSYNSAWYESDFTLNNGYTTTNGWATDQGGDGQGTPPTIALGQGFFLHETLNAGSWTQTYPIP